MIVNTFGQYIKKARQAKGWSQPQLSFASGIHVTTIAKVETAQRKAGPKTVKELCDALGIQKPAEVRT